MVIYYVAQKMNRQLKISPANFFSRVFNQFLQQSPENNNSSEESIKISNHQEPSTSTNPTQTPDELANRKCDCQMSDLITQQHLNLATALREEKEKSESLQCQVEELEKRLNLTKRKKVIDPNAEKLMAIEQKKNVRSLSRQTAFCMIEDRNRQIQELECKNQELLAELEEKDDKIYNICVLYMMLKKDKDTLFMKIGWLQKEFDKVTQYLVEKLTEVRSEIIVITDTRCHTEEDFRALNLKKVVQKNGQLALENSMYRLEMSQLKQIIFDLKNETTTVGVGKTKHPVKTVPSNSTVSSSFVRGKSLNNATGQKSSKKYPGKIAKMPVRSTHCSGKYMCPHNQLNTNTEDRRTADFVNNLPDQLKKCPKNISDRYAEDSDDLTNKKSPNSNQHDVDAVFQKNAKESLILQATSTQTNQSLKLDFDTISGYSEVSSSLADNDSPLNSCGNASETNLRSKRLYSEKSQFSIHDSLQKSKSAPNILQSTEHYA